MPQNHFGASQLEPKQKIKSQRADDTRKRKRETLKTPSPPPPSVSQQFSFAAMAGILKTRIGHTHISVVCKNYGDPILVGTSLLVVEFANGVRNLNVSRFKSTYIDMFVLCYALFATSLIFLLLGFFFAIFWYFFFDSSCVISSSTT